MLVRLCTVSEGNPQGAPQGGVISPLLANIYLLVLDRIWKVKKVEEQFKARLIRYADDFVVLCQGQRESAEGNQNGPEGFRVKAQ
jgi:retron-type reverse transcriptase